MHDAREAMLAADGLSVHVTDAKGIGGVPLQSAPVDSHPTGPITLSGATPAQPTNWLARYVAALVALDLTALMLGGLLGHLLRFNRLSGEVYLGPQYHGVNYWGALLTVAPFWVLALATARTYDTRHLGLGSGEFRRVANAAAHFTALLVLAAFLFKLDLTRGLIVLALPAATLLTILFRFLARKVLHHKRATGAASHRVLVVGNPGPRDDLVHRLRAAPNSGLQVVGVSRPISTRAGSPSVEHLVQMANGLNADTIAVAHSPDVSPPVLRELAWSLEGNGIALLVAPALTDVAGPRVSIKPVAGLPLLQIAEPELTGFRRVLKGTFDVVSAGLGLAVISPIMLALAVAVRLSGPGPVLFRQVRIGKDGREFVMFKFRSMVVDAEKRLEQLKSQNDHGDEAVMFKMREDPRITRIGRILRRYSLDELPQLLNVLRGDMSLVGPRPPLPTEVAQYVRPAHRRLLVKPGMTGLWQVSGRSDLDWEETVRLDLYYVENWSVALDTEIIAKTALAVFKGSGAR